MARRQVDLPDPLGPMIATRSPAATSKLTPLRTESRPKRFWRPVTRSRGAVSAIAHQGKPFTKEKPTARAEPGRRPLQAQLLAAGRNPIRWTIDAAARADGARREPGVAGHAVARADLLDFATGPQFPPDGVHVFGYLRVFGIYAEPELGALAGQHGEVGIVVGEGRELQFPIWILCDHVAHDRRIGDDGLDAAVEKVADGGVRRVIERQLDIL